MVEKTCDTQVAIRLDRAVSVPLQFVQVAIAGTGKHPAEHPTGALLTIPRNPGLQYPYELLPFIWENSPIVMRFLTADFTQPSFRQKTQQKKQLFQTTCRFWNGLFRNRVFSIFRLIVTTSGCHQYELQASIPQTP